MRLTVIKDFSLFDFFVNDSDTQKAGKNMIEFVKAQVELSGMLELEIPASTYGGLTIAILYENLKRQYNINIKQGKSYSQEIAVVQLNNFNKDTK